MHDIKKIFTHQLLKIYFFKWQSMNQHSTEKEMLSQLYT